MKHSKLEQWVRQIAATEEHEISCSECLDLVSDYVDLEVGGEPIPARFAGLRQHLGQCRVCREDYEMLRDLVAQDNQGTAPSLDDLKNSS